MSNEELVDLIINQAKDNNVDSVPPRRYILRMARTSSINLIAQKLLERTLYREASLFTTIECIELERTDRIKCPLVDLRRCDTLMKSTKPLPKPIFSRLGASFKNIRSVDGGFEFSIGYESQIRRDKNRKHSYGKDVYVYLGSDGYLYTPEEIYHLSLDMITIETEKCGCDDECKSGWDYEFIVPDRFVKAVVDETVQKILVRKQTPEDQNPNLINGN